MEFLLKKRNRVWIIIAFWLFVAVLLTTRSSIGQLHKLGFTHWLQNFFFQGSGVLIWGLFTPMLIYFTKRFDLTSGNIGKALVAHLALSIPFAIIHRALALSVDFGLRSLVGMAFFDTWNPFSIVYTFRFVILESAISSFIIYWVITSVLSAIYYYIKAQRRKLEEVTEPRPAFGQLKVRVDGAYKLVPIESIISCEASGNYVNLFTSNGEYRIRETMNELEKKLRFPFIRIHRSSIINVQFLESFEHLYQGEYLLKFSNGRQLTSTRAYRQNLQHLIASPSL